MKCIEAKIVVLGSQGKSEIGRKKNHETSLFSILLFSFVSPSKLRHPHADHQSNLFLKHRREEQKSQSADISRSHAI
jgi:hypothetical protein